MHAVHVVARVLLGVVFVAAGGSKVASGRAWPAQAAELGVGRPLAMVVPWVELIVGALTIVGVVEPWPATVALLLLLLFTTVLVRTLKDGRRPPCACFGAWSAKPLGWTNVARNAAFAALALLTITTH